MNMTRSREIVALMGKIVPGCTIREAAVNCKKLIAIFSAHPEIKEHLVTHFGVAPILEMFEATQCHPAVHRGPSVTSTNFDPLYSRSSSGAYITLSIVASNPHSPFTDHHYFYSTLCIRHLPSI